LYTVIAIGKYSIRIPQMAAQCTFVDDSTDPHLIFVITYLRGEERPVVRILL